LLNEEFLSRTPAMHQIRIPAEHWGRVWRALVASGLVSRVSEVPVYVVSDQQVRLLRRKTLPFELLPRPNRRTPGNSKRRLTPAQVGLSDEP
jgi:hypothetical protein